MQLLTLAIQATALLWAAGLTYLAIREARRALAARRRRRVFWRDLLRSSRAATADLPPPPPAIGARVGVIGTDITGTVLRTDGARIVILDDDRDTWRFSSDPAGEEGTLAYRAADLRHE